MLKAAKNKFGPPRVYGAAHVCVFKAAAPYQSICLPGNSSPAEISLSPPKSVTSSISKLTIHIFYTILLFFNLFPKDPLRKDAACQRKTVPAGAADC